MNDIKYLGVQGLEELIALTKNNLAKKADTLQFDVMPDPVKYTGKVVQYVGISDVSYTRSHFYYSDGTRWTGETISDEQTIKIKIVYALPDWINADPQVLYVLKGTENKLLSLYVKNTAVNDSWYTTESSGSFAIVNDLPEWYAADHNTIYFKAEGSDAALTGYIKNTEASDAWYTVGAQQEVDTFLSSTSTNPVQNKIVYAAIQDVLAKIVNVYHFKGSCLTADLPSEGNAVGDTWNLEDASIYGPAGVNVAWTGTEWDALSGDINSYKTEETIIGKWINGKPIYRRIFNLSEHTEIPDIFTETTHNYYTPKIKDIDLLINANYTIITVLKRNNYRSCSVGSTARLDLENGSIFVASKDDSTTTYEAMYTTVEYTKTTD